VSWVKMAQSEGNGWKNRAEEAEAELNYLRIELARTTERAKKLEAEVENLRNDSKYPDPEDMPGELAAKHCPFNDPLHFHHDGCPSEWAVEERAKKAEAEVERLENTLKAELKRSASYAEDFREVEPLIEAAEKALPKIQNLIDHVVCDTYTAPASAALATIRAALSTARPPVIISEKDAEDVGECMMLSVSPGVGLLNWLLKKGVDAVRADSRRAATDRRQSKEEE
jgi:chromosome segregation ATPase